MVIDGDDLRLFAERVLLAENVPPAKARLMADSLVAANLRGVDSHGILLLPHYVEQLRAGNIDPLTDGRIAGESAACLVYDGMHGIGQHIASICCDHATRLSRQHGIGVVSARNSSHFGAAAFWALRISRVGMAGMVMTNASAIVAPWQGRDGRIGTNPICLSVPSAGKGGWLLDMATTTVAKNKIVQAAARGETTIPAGWAMDSEGNPTRDAAEALRGLLMPLGGYKGSGLGMMVEILCGVLSGGAIGTEVGGLHLKNRTMDTSHFFLAIDIARFMPLQQFQERMERLIGTVKSTRPAQGFDEILVAGDPEWRAEQKRRQDGIPMDESLRKRLEALTAGVGVSMPAYKSTACDSSGTPDDEV
jgi:LDH2 family malate/lactate/ureidoglycolate dehydrogenase